jgi:hypothetical protein
MKNRCRGRTRGKPGVSPALTRRKKAFMALSSRKETGRQPLAKHVVQLGVIGPACTEACLLFGEVPALDSSQPHNPPRALPMNSRVAASCSLTVRRIFSGFEHTRPCA